MRVLGIDPGLANTGVGLVSGKGHSVESFSCGTITTRPDFSTSERLGIIYEQILKIITEFEPDMMVVEDIFTLGSYPKSAISLAKVTGAVLVAGRYCHIEVVEVAVREAKKVLTGNGAASKAQLELAVRQRLNSKVPIRPSHASDALALALIGLYRGKALIKKPIQ
jgi:crossover junction endodeoxyribonuclease RuvC